MSDTPRTDLEVEIIESLHLDAKERNMAMVARLKRFARILEAENEELSMKLAKARLQLRSLKLRNRSGE